MGAYAYVYEIKDIINTEYPQIESVIYGEERFIKGFVLVDQEIQL